MTIDAAVEAAARKIDPLAFEKGHAPRGWEHATQAELDHMRALRKRRACKLARKIIAAFLRAAEATEGMNLAGHEASYGAPAMIWDDQIPAIYRAMSTKAADEVEGGGR